MLVQIFWSSPKIWLHLVPLQKLLYRRKKQFYWMQIIFLSGTKCLWLSQYVNIFLVWHKKFEPAQNFLRPVKGQGKSLTGYVKNKTRHYVHSQNTTIVSKFEFYWSFGQNLTNFDLNLTGTTNSVKTGLNPYLRGWIGLSQQSLTGFQKFFLFMVPMNF